MTISYHLYLPHTFKFWTCYITGQWDEFRVKNGTLCLHPLFEAFFVVFYQKICVFIIFISFIDEASSFRNRVLTNQKSELVARNYQWNCMIWCSTIFMLHYQYCTKTLHYLLFHNFHVALFDVALFQYCTTTLHYLMFHYFHVAQVDVALF